MASDISVARLPRNEAKAFALLLDAISAVRDSFLLIAALRAAHKSMAATKASLAISSHP
jgi:hypothetical protein